jgi:acetyltransferase-like isoleucine patch superfamily enzyme
LRSKRIFYFSTILTFFYSTYLKVKDIRLGKKCTFYGLPCFQRHPYSIINIGNNCTFRSDKTSNLIGVNHKCIIATHSKNASIEIGDNCGFSGVTIGAMENIKIGNNFLCGANVLISDFDWHNIDPNLRNANCLTSKPVVIENNVFIGYNSIIWKGVKIGQNSVIGAGSIVTQDIPPNVIAAGNPCKVIRNL